MASALGAAGAQTYRSTPRAGREDCPNREAPCAAFAVRLAYSPARPVAISVAQPDEPAGPRSATVTVTPSDAVVYPPSVILRVQVTADTAESFRLTGAEMLSEPRLAVVPIPVSPDRQRWASDSIDALIADAFGEACSAPTGVPAEPR